MGFWFCSTDADNNHHHHNNYNNYNHNYNHNHYNNYNNYRRGPYYHAAGKLQHYHQYACRGVGLSR